MQLSDLKRYLLVAAVVSGLSGCAAAQAPEPPAPAVFYRAAPTRPPPPAEVKAKVREIKKDIKKLRTELDKRDQRVGPPTSPEGN